MVASMGTNPPSVIFSLFGNAGEPSYLMSKRKISRLYLCMSIICKHKRLFFVNTFGTGETEANPCHTTEDFIMNNIR